MSASPVDRYGPIFSTNEALRVRDHRVGHALLTSLSIHRNGLNYLPKIHLPSSKIYISRWSRNPQTMWDTGRQTRTKCPKKWRMFQGFLSSLLQSVMVGLVNLTRRLKTWFYLGYAAGYVIMFWLRVPRTSPVRHKWDCNGRIGAHLPILNK